MKVTQKELSEAAGISLSKVKTDVSRGRLDMEDLREVSGYVVSHLMLGGIERVVGLLRAESVIPVGPPVGAPVGDFRGGPMDAVVHDEIDPREIIPDNDWQTPKWGEFEEEFMMGKMRTGLDRKVAERGVVSWRKEAGVEMLEREDAEGLGI